jgi:hypothetical protein
LSGITGRKELKTYSNSGQVKKEFGPAGICVIPGDMENYYADILITLADAEVKFVLAGGVACVLHGVERLTFDIDIAVDMSKENLDRFFTVLQALNFKPRLPVELEFLKDPERVRDAVQNKNALMFTVYDPELPIKQIDIFLSKENSYQQLISSTVSVEIGGRTISLVTVAKLIEMKRAAGREKDISDIAELERLMSC